MEAVRSSSCRAVSAKRTDAMPGGSSHSSFSSFSRASCLRDVGCVPERPYTYGPYLSRLLTGDFCDSHHACLAQSRPGGPCLPILAGAPDPSFPGLFRFTCYYYRGATTKRLVGPAVVRGRRAARHALPRGAWFRS